MLNSRHIKYNKLKIKMIILFLITQLIMILLSKNLNKMNKMDLSIK